MAHEDQSLEKQERPIKTILVVEDDIFVGEFLVEALKDGPYRALLASDGVQALEIVKTVLPDLFLLDYQLPGFNGLELAKRLAAIEVSRPIPILLMSANLPKQALEEQQIAFIAKPFELDELFQAIATLLAK